MSFAFKNHQNLYASDYIERKKALNNYQYFNQRIHNPINIINHPNIISNYNGTTYFKKNISSNPATTNYYLANTRSYKHLISITKGAYLIPSIDNSGIIDTSCVLCPDISVNLNGELYEGNYNTVTSDVIKPPNPNSVSQYIDISENACDINDYKGYIRSGNIKFNDLSYVKNKYMLYKFKLPSKLQQ